MKRGTVEHGDAQSSRVSEYPLADIRTTATLTPGAITQRVSSVRTKRSKAIKTSARRLLANRTATVTICISLDVADLAAIDEAATEARLARSTYLVECWRKASSGSLP